MEYTDIELKNEKWKDIDGYDGMYQVSDLGRVRSRYSGEWRVLRPGTNSVGYSTVSLHNNKKQNTIKVHRLVASAFIPNDDESKTQINHINEVKTDNRVTNLEWCDRSYNMSYNGLQKRRYHPKYKRDEIRHLYNPELSIPKNLELLKANGIDCSRETVIRLRKDLGLINKK